MYVFIYFLLLYGGRCFGLVVSKQPGFALLRPIFNCSEGRYCNTFAHSDKSVKLARQVDVTLLFKSLLKNSYYVSYRSYTCRKVSQEDAQ